MNPIPSLVAARQLYDQADAYPGELAAAERQALEMRWAALQRAPKAADQLAGLALSGGGIRSATFSLGVLQSLAKQKLLGDVDFLSTVSGGGYVGGFWGTWLNRLRKPSAWLGRDYAAAEQLLADTDSPQVNWLRENGRYLAPNGTGDEWLIATVLQRNFLVLHLIIAPLLLAGFALLAAITTAWPRFRWVAAVQVAGHAVTVAGNTLLLKGLLLAAVGGAVLGLAFFLLPGGPGGVVGNRVTRWQAALGQVFFALLAIWIIDFIGGSVYATAVSKLVDHPVRVSASFGLALAAVLSGMRWIKSSLLATASSEGGKVPTTVWVALGAAALVLLWMSTLATMAHAVVGAPNPDGSFAWWPWAVVGGCAALALFLSPWTALLNRTSLASLYAARLARAYLGASNEERKNRLDVTETMAGDEEEFAGYFPHAMGGPLHIVNVTINETMDPMSAVQRNDRKGVPLAVGPSGLSVGVSHHATWVIDAQTRQRTGEVIPAPVPPVGAKPQFSVFSAPPGTAIKVEMLPMGALVGVSGAAVTTGLGSRTSLPFSLFLGFFNVRLGWWWDSGIRPRWRHRTTARPTGRVIEAAAAAVFKTQSYLLNEFAARFHGTARREWYLSDGGHFENTGAYELIRRRVPFIVICDNGSDPDRTGTDFANLVRKARVDFAADIEVIDPRGVPTLPPDLLPLVGTLDDLSVAHRKPGEPLAKGILFARVTYARSAAQSLLVLIKPTIRGDEAAPERNYSALNQAFPQESTAEQFYGEDQWESYRALGEAMADRLFAGRKLEAASFGL